MAFPVVQGDLPFITTDDMREVDHAMVDDYGILLMQMMENAGRCLAIVARDRFLSGDPRGHRVVVLAGRGGNGGGGLVAARRLDSWGADVEVRLAAPPDTFSGVPAHQLDLLSKMSVPLVHGSGIGARVVADVILDAVIGYSLSGAPMGASAELINVANSSDAPVLALDAPSGVDTATGQVYEPSVNADATMTLALPKIGLKAQGAMTKVGELYLADIGVPPELYEREPLSLNVGPIFAVSDIVRVW